MTQYVLRRLAQAIPVLLGITLFTFLMIHLTPGDPVVIYAMGKPLSEEREAQIREQFGLDRPLWEQYRNYMSDLLRGDLGSGLHDKRPVWDTIREAIWPTLQLTLAGLAVAIVLGVTLGILAALFHNTWLDSATMVVALLGVSTPVFYLGLLLLFAFSFHFHLFPATGTGGWQNLVLPALTVGFASAAYIARLVRSSMLEVLRQDYVTTARAKGVRERVVVTSHALKNALIPVVTFFGIQLAGLGRVAITAITSRDFPLIQGTVLVTAIVYVLVNLVIDLSYAAFDPRIRYE
jgi:peptide/nickel transport system permease protein